MRCDSGHRCPGACPLMDEAEFMRKSFTHVMDWRPDTAKVDPSFSDICSIYNDAMVELQERIRERLIPMGRYTVGCRRGSCEQARDANPEASISTQILQAVTERKPRGS